MRRPWPPRAWGPGGDVRGLAAGAQPDRRRRIAVAGQRCRGQHDHVEDQVTHRADERRAPRVGGWVGPVHALMIAPQRGPDRAGVLRFALVTVTASPQPLVLSERVAAALSAGAPVVALESTIITHGLPHPDNVQAARDFEQTVSDAGATPATIAVLDGVPHIGIDGDQLERLAGATSALKLSARDLPVAIARGVSGGTTVAATALLATRAGIRVFATGGIGGVHRNASETFDESADLTILSQCPITVVSAGGQVDPRHPGHPRAPGEPESVTVLVYGTPGSSPPSTSPTAASPSTTPSPAQPRSRRSCAPVAGSGLPGGIPRGQPPARGRAARSGPA